MENQEENMLPPFWLQTSNIHQKTNLHRRRLRRSSSILFSSGALIVFLLVIAFAFIFIIIPTVRSFTSQIFKPQLVKKSWDSLNLILVLFAIVCGFLSRNTNIENNTSSYEGYRSVSNASQHTKKSNPTTPHQWHQFSEHNGYNNNNKYFRRLRSSSSHPDLRQETFLVNRDERWRFYDDTHVTNFRHFDSDQLHYRRPWQEVDKDENLETKTIEVDAFLVKAKEEDSQTHPPPRTQSPPPNPHPHPPPPPPLPPPLPQTPPKVVKPKQRRTHQVIAQKEEIAKNPEINDLELKVETFQKPPPRYNSLPPPIPLVYEVVHHKSSANERSRGGAKEFLTSLKRKKKKQRQKSVENFETILNKFYSSSASASAPLPLHPPSSPPPPLPPHSVFHNLFSSKKAKTKKLCLLSQASSAHPPTPPPPKRPITQTVSKSKTHLSKPILEHKPPLATKKYEHSRVVNDDNSPKSGSESSLIPIPPPPPPPPFKLPELKFVKHGDFVRLKSNTSSRSSSPDLDDDGEDSASDRVMSPSANGIGMEGRESPSPIFFSSPDVNTKADTFIARFRAGLKLEKVDSVEKQRGRVKSNLGPRSILGQE